MLFEIWGNNQQILEALKLFDEEAKTEYKASILRAKQILATMGQQLHLPDEWMMIYWEQDYRIYVRFPFTTPMIIKLYRRHKSMEKNLRKFLEHKGIQAKVKWKNEQEENEICSKTGG
jgi:hypothetical protein